MIGPFVSARDERDRKQNAYPTIDSEQSTRAVTFTSDQGSVQWKPAWSGIDALNPFLKKNQIIRSPWRLGLTG